MRRTAKLIPLSLVALLLYTGGPAVFAATVTPNEITELQSEIQNRKAQIESINNKLEEYKKKIAEYSKKASSLQNDIAILENESAMTELDVAATQNSIEEENLHLSILDSNIEDADAKLARQKELLNDLLFEINKQDRQGGIFEMIIGARNFNDVFAAADQLQSVNSDLRKTLIATQQTKSVLQDKKAEREERLAALSDLQVELDTKIQKLDAQVNAKEVLNTQTRESELEYRVLLSDLRQEQQGITQRINQLQQDIENRLAESDDAGDTTVISWPVMGRITTTFHDPTYPFRYLFEHSGLDIAVPQGTPIEAAAPGYVAWAQTGRQYGNYVMIIHANGLATLYAHMSRMDVVADQYVTRGQIIGLTGGRPGTQGAGFSTGPHLHFEVRQNGIPTDPMKFLP
ncbi:MAG TPA: peptidoglycan DD-metalloendopeptidase family protein [bacterium]|nr:peptidoglycan DD-metalloendopeptidase family protein [bacterium]